MCAYVVLLESICDVECVVALVCLCVCVEIGMFLLCVDIVIRSSGGDQKKRAGGGRTTESVLLLCGGGCGWFEREVWSYQRRERDSLKRERKKENRRLRIR